MIAAVVAACVGASAMGIGAEAATNEAVAQVRVRNDLNFFGSNVKLERQATNAIEELNARSARAAVVEDVLGEADPATVDSMRAARRIDGDIVTVRVRHRDPAVAAQIANAWAMAYVADRADRATTLETTLAQIAEQRSESFARIGEVEAALNAERNAIGVAVGAERVGWSIAAAIASPELATERRSLQTEIRVLDAEIAQVRRDINWLNESDIVRLGAPDGSDTTIPPAGFALPQWLITGLGLGLIVATIAPNRLLTSEIATRMAPTSQTIARRRRPVRRGAVDPSTIGAAILREHGRGQRIFGLKARHVDTGALADWLAYHGHEVGIVGLSATADVHHATGDGVVVPLSRSQFERLVRRGVANDTNSIVLADLDDIRSRTANTEREIDVLAIVDVDAGRTSEADAARDLELAHRVADRTIAFVA